MRSKALCISALVLLLAFFPQLRAEPVIESGAVTEPRALIDCCGLITICPGFPCLCLWPLDWCSFLTCNWCELFGIGLPQWCNACSLCNIGFLGGCCNACSLFNLGLVGDCLNPCSGINLGCLAGAIGNLCSFFNLGIFVGAILNPCSCCNLGLVGALVNPCSVVNAGAVTGALCNPCSGCNMGIYGALVNPCSCCAIESCLNLWSCGCSDIPPIPSFSLCNWLPCCWGVGEIWVMAPSCLSGVLPLSYISSTITFASSRLFLILQTIAAYCGISELL